VKLALALALLLAAGDEKVPVMGRHHRRDAHLWRAEAVARDD